MIDWIVEVEKYAPEKVCMLLVGNKSDRAEKVVSTEKAKAFADSYKIPFIEVSAKSNTNIDEAFHKLTMDLVACRDGAGSSSNEKMKNNNIRFFTQNLASQLNKCC
jgi:GTPase SAR1 family protein